MNAPARKLRYVGCFADRVAANGTAIGAVTVAFMLDPEPDPRGGSVPRPLGHLLIAVRGSSDRDPRAWDPELEVRGKRPLVMKVYEAADISKMPRLGIPIKPRIACPTLTRRLVAGLGLRALQIGRTFDALGWGVPPVVSVPTHKECDDWLTSSALCVDCQDALSVHGLNGRCISCDNATSNARA